MDARKLNAIKKVMEDVRTLAEFSDITGDSQAKFISETIRVVLLAGNDANHAELLGNHILNFLNELEMYEGTKNPIDHLTYETPLCQN
jgi:hypothetical protein